MQSLPFVRSVRPDAPPELEAICARALALNPVQRYSTAADMRAALLAFLETRGLQRASHEEIGRQVATAFSEERAKIQSVIDRQLAALEQQQSSEINLVDLRSLASTCALVSRAPSPLSLSLPSS